jgi:hypothetical protein
MAWIEHSLFRDVDELLQYLGSVNVPQMTWRGQAKDFEAGEVHSSFDRVVSHIAGMARYEAERRIALRFRELSGPIIPEAEKRFLDDGPTFLMLMQHYGAPTRLVDWTRSSYIAAYFAVDSAYDSDGIIWGFDGAVLDTNAHKLHHDETANVPLSHDTDRLPIMMWNEYRPWVCRLMSFGICPKRMARQKGVFTVGGRHGIDHITAIDHLVGDNEGGGKHIIRIDRSIKVELLRKLNTKNINGLELFLDMEGVGKAATEYGRYLV